MNELLMSIKTRHADRIFSGIKKYEFRRKNLGEHNLNKKTDNVCLFLFNI